MMVLSKMELLSEFKANLEVLFCLDFELMMVLREMYLLIELKVKLEVLFFLECYINMSDTRYLLSST